jgi:hypothetical protein
MSPREGLVRDLCERLSDAVGQGVDGHQET